MKHQYKYYLRLLWVKLMRAGALTGCHQLPERSFYFRGYQFPVCARCVGVLLGEITTVLLLAFHLIICIPIALAFALVMFLDWFIQYVGIKESNNYRRLLTGILGGIGCWSVFFHALIRVIGFLKSQF